jgi:hypothetical protein
MRRRLVLPLPLGPVSCRNVPGESEKSRPLKTLRSPLIQPSWLTSKMVRLPPVTFGVRRHCMGVRRENHSR